jgi:hypothetical protein
MHLEKLPLVFHKRGRQCDCETKLNHISRTVNEARSPQQPLDLRGHNEVALGQPVDLMGPERNPGLAPGQ